MIKTLLLWQVGLIANVKLHFFYKPMVDYDLDDLQQW